MIKISFKISKLSSHLFMFSPNISKQLTRFVNVRKAKDICMSKTFISDAVLPETEKLNNRCV